MIQMQTNDLELAHQKIPTQPLRYIGAKFRAAPLYAAKLLKLRERFHSNTLIEGFTGTASISFEVMKYKGFSAYRLNDIDPAISCYLIAIRDYPTALIDCIRNAEFSRLFYAESIVLLKRIKSIPITSTEIVDVAFRKIFVHRYSFSGLGVISTTPVTKGSSRWNDTNLILAIQILHHRMKWHNVVIENRRYEEILNVDSGKVLHLIDPPYAAVGDKVYQYGFQQEDHIHLAQIIKSMSSPFLLCYDDHDLIWDLYGTWAKIERIPTWHSNQNTRKNELIITPKNTSQKLVFVFEENQRLSNNQKNQISSKNQKFQK